LQLTNIKKLAVSGLGRQFAAVLGGFLESCTLFGSHDGVVQIRVTEMGEPLKQRNEERNSDNDEGEEF
jgi:hypothetical protein